MVKNDAILQRVVSISKARFAMTNGRMAANVPNRKLIEALEQACEATFVSWAA
jgi:hypothetical protein